ncbi:MARCKS-related protein [Apus apus]|uniref:MARCKS-related protein n=1 Tax=Apus apus TaxID=8895 RepID=UPI0021F8F31D|nr:MARCKS-related protein [Apus apus]
MGSQGSKAAAANATEPAKANGQENGHVRLNGDMTPKMPPLNGNGSAEPLKEESKDQAGGEDAIEPAPPAEGGDAKPEGAAAPKDTPKKKKKFSFKKSFKLSGISFRKNKKEAGDSSGSSPTEDQQGKGEETPACSASGTEPSAPPEEGTAEEQGSPPESSRAAEGQQGAEPKGEDVEAGGSKEEEKQQQQQGESHGDTAKPEEPSKPAGPEATTALEQKEE